MRPPPSGVDHPICLPRHEDRRPGIARGGVLMDVGEVIDALRVAAFVFISIGPVLASLVVVLRDDHSWLDRPRF